MVASNRDVCMCVYISTPKSRVYELWQLSLSCLTAIQLAGTSCCESAVLGTCSYFPYAAARRCEVYLEIIQGGSTLPGPQKVCKTLPTNLFKGTQKTSSLLTFGIQVGALWYLLRALWSLIKAVWSLLGALVYCRFQKK